MSTSKQPTNIVWVFLAEGAYHPCAVFSSREEAEAWILSTSVTGTLTAYELNKPVYDWAIERGYFTPTHKNQKTPKFIARFSSAYAEHYHYKEGTNTDCQADRKKP